MGPYVTFSNLPTGHFRLPEKVCKGQGLCTNAVYILTPG